MTRTLIVTRHAKSDWDAPTLDDHDRQLNQRGRRAAKAIGRWLAAEGHAPDQVLSSTARRIPAALLASALTSSTVPPAWVISAASCWAASTLEL